VVNLAYNESDHEEALKLLNLAARWLDRISPDAAAQSPEGIEETLTVVRLGVPELLRKTLATTNPIESAFSVAQNVTPGKSAGGTATCGNDGVPPDCCVRRASLAGRKVVGGSPSCSKPRIASF
jgi:hypothetical protein